ncbi:MAG: site-2 protease family protein [Acidobacteria bacterium]|nr:MAG: site-2 protease family protein [Acidobacteriota bacterium]
MGNITKIDLVEFAIYYAFFLLSAAVHESAHAWTASQFGDPTAKLQGRISLNPANHIELFGTVILPLIFFFSGGSMFGWAKPTPVNPKNFKNPRRDGMFVSGAGPVSNLLSVALLVILWHISYSFVTLGSENKIPALFCYVLGSGILVNLILFVFNLLPVYPLDGSGVLAGLLPGALANAYDQIRPFSFLLLLLIFWVPAAQHVLGRIIFGLGHLFRIDFFSLSQIW